MLASVDLAAVLAHNPVGITAKGLARVDIPLLEPTDETRSALALMAERNLFWLPVVEDRANRLLVGIIYERDIHRTGTRAAAAAAG
jgi:CBS domain-containing protein